MSALKQYQRDLELSVRLGDPTLRLPDQARLLEWVADSLCPPGAPTPSSAELMFARWKPGTAILGSWRVRFSDNSQRFINWKSYAGNKTRALGSSMRVDDAMLNAVSPLAAYAYLPEHSGHLTCFPMDRILRVAARVLDMRRLGRMLDASGIWTGKVMRRQASSIELLRLKPEHRAVFRLDAKLKNDRQEPRVPAGTCTLAVRALSPKKALRVVSNRQSGPSGIFPDLLFFDREQGVLFEDWIAGDPVAWNDFSQAASSARLLLQLHQPTPFDLPLKHSRFGALELLSRIPMLRHIVDKIPVLKQTPGTHWIHADFHADQLIRQGRNLRLLDADCVRPGAPEEDFASWVADRVQNDPELDTESAMQPLMEGYSARAAGLNLELIAKLTSEQLIQRAAACLRRLQVDAELNAARMLERARAISSETIHR